MKLFSAKLEDAGQSVVWIFKPRHKIYPPVGLIHAMPDGGPVLRNEVGVSTIAGVFVRLRKMMVWLQFRRFWKAGMK